MWSEKIKPTLTFEKVWQYEDFVGMIETTVKRLMEETFYDTVHNFEEFYRSFKRSNTPDLAQFFQNYAPPINRRHHMCVSLAMECVARLSAGNKWIGDYFYLVSCEEAIEISSLYVDHFEEKDGFTLEKEHSLLAMQICVAGREGVMLLDPGYHIARAVTVMQDQLYPHTGWFTQSNENGCMREYRYSFSPKSPKFVVWSERQTRDNTQQHEMSLVYVGKAYRTAIDVTVRRNLVYNFRSLLSRDAKGRVCAGVYFPVVNNTDVQLTIFYDGAQGNNVKVKQKFAVFKDVSKIPEASMAHIVQLAPQLRMPIDELTSLLQSMAEVMTDQSFVKQVLVINDSINSMSADN